MNWYNNSLIKEAKLEAPPIMYQQIYDWCCQNIELFLLINNLDKDNKLLEIIKNKYPNVIEFNKKDIYIKYPEYRKYFKINMTGCSHEQLLEGKDFQKWIDAKQKHIKNFKNNDEFKNLKDYENNLIINHTEKIEKDSIEVILKYGKEEEFADASYNLNKPIITIYIYKDMLTMQEMKNHLKECIQHELIHFIQDIFKQMLNINFAKPKKSKQILNEKQMEQDLKIKGFDKSEIIKIVHDIRDIEFYPVLITLYEQFKEYMKKETNTKIRFNKFITEDYVLQEIKNISMQKYKLFVKILYKMIFNDF